MRSCRKGRCAPPVHMIKLTETRESLCQIAPLCHLFRLRTKKINLLNSPLLERAIERSGKVVVIEAVKSIPECAGGGERPRDIG
jgi:hypothetical protein